MSQQFDPDKFAGKIDAACDEGKPAKLEQLLQECDDYLVTVEGVARVDLHFFKGNIYSILWQIKAKEEGSWGWNQHEVVQEILSLRQAICEPEFENSDIVKQCKVRTNLANSLSTLGRSVEAIEEYSNVIETIPSFAMALGNRAYAISAYSYYLYDLGHERLLLDQSRRDYRDALHLEALWDSGPHPEAENQFKENLSGIDKHLQAIQFDQNFDLSAFSLGETAEEIEYRQWSLNNGLFINPLNDITVEAVAANDVLHLPSHSYGLDEEVRFPAFYNILKQEYVSARFHLFDSQPKDEEHFADRDILLMDSFDYGVFGFRAEQLKLAFRSAYSIFDKIALFVNDYFQVGLRPKDVSFRKIWERQIKGGDIVLRDAFVGSENLPLRGLYFLSKDFFDKEFSEFASPEAKDLDQLRNFLEHRFVTLTDLGLGGESSDLHRRVDLVEFQQRAMRLLKLSRAALIYLSLAMHREEQLRKEKSGGDDERITMPVVAVPIIRDQL